MGFMPTAIVNTAARYASGQSWNSPESGVSSVPKVPLFDGPAYRTENPYQNPYMWIGAVGVNARERNMVLEEKGSLKIFGAGSEEMAALVRGVAHNPATLALQDFHLTPFTLASRRFFGALHAHELHSLPSNCRVIESPGVIPFISPAYADAAYGFALFYRGAVQVITSYFAAHNDSLFVAQVQGVSQKTYHRRDRGLAKIAWKDLVLQVCESVGKELGCTALVYQGAKNNRWTNTMKAQGEDDGYSTNCEPALALEKCRLNYDNFCESRGFRSDRQGNFVKSL